MSGQNGGPFRKAWHYGSAADRDRANAAYRARLIQLPPEPREEDDDGGEA